MSRRTGSLDTDLRDYMLRVSVEETAALKELRELTGKMENSGMQISPEQGQLLNFLVKLTEAKTVLEIGVFTGYSSIWTAMALPDDGVLTACDTSREWTETATEYWKKAGVDGKIQLHLGPAGKTLEDLLDKGMKGRYDFAFIDADKSSYDIYYDLCLELVGQGGLIALDNVFRGGRVLNNGPQDNGTETIDRLNLRIFNDDRVDQAIIPVSDGLTLVRKR